ncbi:MAG: hypothetical protein ACTFAL_16245 [Candidatus Electronema sp. V4]|uniref:hypothetical protein n=1 Tax=Candidatus Electronema sp. V4 TaxID=3454756 RepID=UPI0040554A3C
MKKNAQHTIAALLLTSTFFSSALAKFDLPDYVYPASQLNEAQEKAKISKKALAFVGTDKETTCPIATAASLEVFNGLKDSSVVVYVEQGELDNLPKIASEALDSEAAGKYIPKTAVVSADLSKLILVLSDAEPAQRAEKIKAAQDEISSYLQKNN